MVWAQVRSEGEHRWPLEQKTSSGQRRGAQRGGRGGIPGDGGPWDGRREQKTWVSPCFLIILDRERREWNVFYWLSVLCVSCLRRRPESVRQRSGRFPWEAVSEARWVNGNSPDLKGTMGAFTWTGYSPFNSEWTLIPLKCYHVNTWKKLKKIIPNENYHSEWKSNPM